MSRFWSLWRWDRGDEEAGPLRLQLAKELAKLVSKRQRSFRRLTANAA